MLTRSGPLHVPVPSETRGAASGAEGPGMGGAQLAGPCWSQSVPPTLLVGASGAPFLGLVSPAAAFTWPSLPSAFLGTTAQGVLRGVGRMTQKTGPGARPPSS